MNTKNIWFALLLLMIVFNRLTLNRWTESQKQTRTAQNQAMLALEIADRWEAAYRACVGTPATPAKPMDNVSLAAK